MTATPVTPVTRPNPVPQQSRSPECEIVIVTHNSKSDLERNWLGRQFPAWLRIIIVDNDSQDGTVETALRITPTVVRSANVGLSKSNNRGAELGNAPYLVFCNPDVYVTAEDVVRLRESAARSRGLVAPRLVGDDGKPQPNARLWPSLPRIVSRRLSPGSRNARAYLWPERAPDWVTGACLAMRRIDFRRAGGWPERYFLYFEDVELCARFRRAGIPVSVDERIRVRHTWRQASAAAWWSAGTRWHLRSAARFYTRHPVLALQTGAGV